MTEAIKQTEIAPEKQDKKELRERLRVLQKIAQRALAIGIHDDLLAKIGNVNIEIDPIETEKLVTQVEGRLGRLGLNTIKSLMEPRELSSIFRVLKQGGLHRKSLLYKTASHEGKEITVTPEVFNHLNLDFTIGTPPITKGHLATIYGAVLGTSDPNELKELCNVLPSKVRNDFLEMIYKMRRIVEGDNHYTTDKELQEHLRCASNFVNLEGGRAFAKTVVSGGAKRAEELLRRYLFKEAGNKIETLECSEPDKKLAETVKDNPDKIFIVKVCTMPSDIWSNNADWSECLGRIIFVDDSDNAKKTNTCYVYSLFDEVIEALDDTHVKVSGKQSLPQMGLREILETFSADKLEEMRSAVEAYENSLSDRKKVSTSEEENEAIIKDKFLTKQVKKFLEQLEIISASSLGNAAMMSDDLRAEVGSIWTKYFYRKLLESDYKSYVGNGGGREGLELVGRYRIQKLHTEAEEYLSKFRSKWEALYQKVKTRSSLSLTTEMSSSREMQSKARTKFTRGFFEEAHLRTANLGMHFMDAVTRKALEKLSTFIERGSRTAADADILTQLDEAINRVILRPDEDADPRSPVGRILGEINDIGGAAKSHILRRLYEFAVFMSAKPDNPEYISDLLDKLLTTEKIDGRLVTEAVKWSYENVFSCDDFPSDLEIHIDLYEDGSPNLRKLREKLVRLKLILRCAPELFELVCKSITVVINSPHNPTGRVYKERDVLALLAVASEFGLTIIDDSSYYKVVRKDENGRRIRVPSVAEIYEYHKHLFPHPVAIITVATATKNQCGAGARLYNIITNDEELIGFLEKERGDTMPHAISLFLTKEKLKASAAIKEIYGILQGIEKFLSGSTVTVKTCVEEFSKKLSSEKLLELNASYLVFKEVMDTYDLLCRLTNRGGDCHHAREIIERLMDRLKYMRIEKGVAKDIDERFSAAEHAIENVSKELGREIVYIKPEGAFYICVGLPDNSKPVLPFLEILNKHKGVGFSQMGDEYFVRLSLGAVAVGTKESYEWLQKRIETALKLLYKYWEEYGVCDTADIFEAKLIALGSDSVELLFEEKSALLKHYLAHRNSEVPFSIERQEDGTIFKIEESSRAVNIVLEGGACKTPEDFIKSKSFRAIYTFLLRNFYGEIKGLAAMRQEEVLSKYPAELLLSAYKRDPRVSPDEREILKQILFTLYRHWYGVRIRTHLVADKTERDSDTSDINRRQQIMGASEIIGQHIATILTAFDHEWEGAKEGSKVPHGFARGYENLGEISVTQDLPLYLTNIVRRTSFVGVTATTNPHPTYNTEMHKRISGREVLFARRDKSKEETTALKARLSDYSNELVKSGEYLCKAVRVGPTRQLLIIHKALLHLLHDQCRLFPETEDVCNPEKLKDGEFDAVLFFGLPKKVMGEDKMTGYFVDQAGGKSLPVGWVARSNKTDYVGFVKKWLLTLHNEIMLQKGAVPVHGALFTIHFRDGAKFTVVAAGDTVTGKSELIAKFMEKIDKLGSDSPIESIEFLAPDMMSLHTAEDDAVYAFGTETGDFVRLDDLIAKKGQKKTEWEKKCAHLLYHATRTNPHKKNARATVPGLCDTEAVLTPQKVDGIFYFNNFETPKTHFSRLTVRQAFDEIKAGRRKPKGTSEDLPDFNACVELSDRADLVKRFGMNFTRALQWDKREEKIYIAYSEDKEVHYTDAVRCVKEMFNGKEFEDPETKERVLVKDISYSPIENQFILKYQNGKEEVLTDEVFGRMYESIINTFYANPFGPTSDMDRMNKNVADLVEVAGKEGVIGGIVYTELGNEKRKEEGLDKAASDLMNFLNDPQFKKEVTARENEILNLVRTKLGDTNVSAETTINNIRRKRKYDARTVVLRSKVKTPYYQGGQTNENELFEADIVPPSIREAIENIISQDYGRTTNFADLKVPSGVNVLVNSSDSKYDEIELIYLIMLKRGIIHFDTTAEEVRENEIEVRKAEYLAGLLKNR